MARLYVVKESGREVAIGSDTLQAGEPFTLKIKYNPEIPASQMMLDGLNCKDDRGDIGNCGIQTPQTEVEAYPNVPKSITLPLDRQKPITINPDGTTIYNGHSYPQENHADTRVSISVLTQRNQWMKTSFNTKITPTKRKNEVSAYKNPNARCGANCIRITETQTEFIWTKYIIATKTAGGYVISDWLKFDGKGEWIDQADAARLHEHVINIDSAKPFALLDAFGRGVLTNDVQETQPSLTKLEISLPVPPTPEKPLANIKITKPENAKPGTLKVYRNRKPLTEAESLADAKRNPGKVYIREDEVYVQTSGSDATFTVYAEVKTNDGKTVTSNEITIKQAPAPTQPASAAGTTPAAGAQEEFAKDEYVKLYIVENGVETLLKDATLYAGETNKLRIKTKEDLRKKNDATDIIIDSSHYPLWCQDREAKNGICVRNHDFYVDSNNFEGWLLTPKNAITASENNGEWTVTASNKNYPVQKTLPITIKTTVYRNIKTGYEDRLHSIAEYSTATKLTAHPHKATATFNDQQIHLDLEAGNNRYIYAKYLIAKKTSTNTYAPRYLWKNEVIDENDDQYIDAFKPKPEEVTAGFLLLDNFGRVVLEHNPIAQTTAATQPSSTTAETPAGGSTEFKAGEVAHLNLVNSNGALTPLEQALLYAGKAFKLKVEYAKAGQSYYPGIIGVYTQKTSSGKADVSAYYPQNAVETCENCYVAPPASLAITSPAGTITRTGRIITLRGEAYPRTSNAEYNIKVDGQTITTYIKTLDYCNQANFYGRTPALELKSDAGKPFLWTRYLIAEKTSGSSYALRGWLSWNGGSERIDEADAHNLGTAPLNIYSYITKEILLLDEYGNIVMDYKPVKLAAAWQSADRNFEVKFTLSSPAYTNTQLYITKVNGKTLSNTITEFIPTSILKGATTATASRQVMIDAIASAASRVGVNVKDVNNIEIRLWQYPATTPVILET